MSMCLNYSGRMCMYHAMHFWEILHLDLGSRKECLHLPSVNEAFDGSSFNTSLKLGSFTDDGSSCQVELILLGEEVRKVVAAGSAADGEQLRRLRALWRGSRLGQLDGEELFLFPNNEAGWLATVRSPDPRFHHVLNGICTHIERFLDIKLETASNDSPE